MPLQTCITTITSVDETITTFKKELFDLINVIIEHRFLWEEIINLVRANNNRKVKRFSRFASVMLCYWELWKNAEIVFDGYPLNQRLKTTHLKRSIEAE